MKDLMFFTDERWIWQMTPPGVRRGGDEERGEAADRNPTSRSRDCNSAELAFRPSGDQSRIARPWRRLSAHALAALLAEQGHYSEAEEVCCDDLGLSGRIQRRA
jgi:hypothetical protein